MSEDLPPNHTTWLDNICAHRHEVSETWNLMYLTDEQAKVCYSALNNIAPEVDVERLEMEIEIIIHEMAPSCRHKQAEAIIDHLKATGVIRGRD